MMSIPECPPLLSLPKTNTSHTTPDISVSSHQRYIGTEVTVSCPDNYFIVGHDVITCLDSLEWSVDSLPHCTDVLYGVPESTKLYIGVFSACALIVLLGFAVVIGKILCKNRKDDRDIFMKSTVSVASLEYFPNDKRYRQAVLVPEADAISGNYQPETIDEHSDVLARYSEQIIDFQNNAIEQNFETFINPSFCDDESTKERWQRRMQGYEDDSGSHDLWRKPQNSSYGGMSRDHWQNPISGYESSFDDDSSYEQLDAITGRESSGQWSIDSYSAPEESDYDRNSHFYYPESRNLHGNDTTPF